MTDDGDQPSTGAWFDDPETDSDDPETDSDDSPDVDSASAAEATPSNPETATETQRTAGPNRSHSPEEVARAQLAALNADGSLAADPEEWETVPETVRTLFDFAAPEYRSLHGSLDAFATALTGPIHDRLLTANAVERGPVDREDGRFVQAVVARHDDGDRTYEFVLALQSGGKYDGCWMTTAIDLVYDGVSPSFRRMPTVRFGDDERTCEEGATLRSVLLESEGYSPHNDVTEVANCGGNGLCGTCAVEVTGETDDPEYREQKRLELPPHDGEADLRLSCQTCVRGDVEVTKHEGLWGQHIQQAAESDADGSEGDAEQTPPEAIPVTDEEYDGTYEYETESAGAQR